jgi:hypothetical protein
MSGDFAECPGAAIDDWAQVRIGGPVGARVEWHQGLAELTDGERVGAYDAGGGRRGAHLAGLEVRLGPSSARRNRSVPGGARMRASCRLPAAANGSYGMGVERHGRRGEVGQRADPDVRLTRQLPCDATEPEQSIGQLDNRFAATERRLGNNEPVQCSVGGSRFHRCSQGARRLP